MNLLFETIVQIFRKIIQLNEVIILKNTNEHYPIFFSKSSLKMDLYPAMRNEMLLLVKKWRRKKLYMLTLVSANLFLLMID